MKLLFRNGLLFGQWNFLDKGGGKGREIYPFQMRCCIFLQEFTILPLPCLVERRLLFCKKIMNILFIYKGLLIKRNDYIKTINYDIHEF